MTQSFEITNLIGRQVWDSRGRPTVEAEIHLADGAIGRAMAPAGASTGSGEAVDLRDGGTRWGGYGVTQAVAGINQSMRPRILGRDVTEQETLDRLLIEVDGTDNKSRLGGNAMIAVSMAIAHAAAAAHEQPLWRYLANGRTHSLPTPEIQIFGGGAHAHRRLDLQDFMIVPLGASSFTEAMEWVAEVYYVAGVIMDQQGKRMGVADEGGYWPDFKSNEQAIDTLLHVIEQAGFDPQTQMAISLDIAATQLYSEGGYYLKAEEQVYGTEDWLEVVTAWLRNYPIVSIEDPFVESDFPAHAELCRRFGNSVQVVGDDLLVTSADKVARAAKEKACNTLLCKPNQAGTLTEAKAAFEAAQQRGMNTIVSARSGETEDVSIVHLALGWGIDQLKVGSFARGERMAKWNEAIRIEQGADETLGYAGAAPFRRLGSQLLRADQIT